MRRKPATSRNLEPADGGHKLETGRLHQTIAYHIRRAQLKLARDFKEHVDAGKLVRGQYTVMSMIAANPGITQVDLSRLLDIDKAALVPLIYRLERTGWLSKKPAQEDRRRHTLFLTALGQRQLDQLNGRMTECEESIRGRFSEREIATLLKLLRRVYE